MVDEATMVATWQQMLAAFVRDDRQGFAAALADQFNGMMNDISLPNRDAFVSAVWAGRERGWTEQQVISVAARSNVLTVHYVNRYSDGSTTEGGGVALFNDDGKIIAVRALTAQPRAIQAT